MNVIRCPECGKTYQTPSEIVNNGGKVYQLGIAIKARCGCGGDLGSVAKIWRKVRNDSD